MSQHLPLVEQFLTYLTDERHFSPYTSRCYGLDLRQFIEFPRPGVSWPPIPRRSGRSWSG